MARLTSTGAMDTTFATSGLWTYNIFSTNGDSAISILVDNANQVIYAGGKTYRWGLVNGSYFYTGTDMILAKLDFNGAPVSTFGTSGNGIVVYYSGTTNNNAADIASGLYMDANGKVFVIGRNNGSFSTKGGGLFYKTFQNHCHRIYSDVVF